MDFNHVDPKLLASGSDDAKGNQSLNVLLWPLSSCKVSIVCTVHSSFLFYISSKNSVLHQDCIT